MKKIIYIVIVLAVGPIFTACEDDILDRTPLDEISDPDFWQGESDLELYLNELYDTFQGWAERGSGAAPTKDLGTDIATPSLAFWGGSTTNRMDGILTVPASGGGWNWGNIRSVNYFLANADRAGTGDLVNHYVGEGHFFRAWFYFDLLRDFGDLPIITGVVDVEDEAILFSERRPRTEVVDFILSDLDIAIANMRAPSNIAAGRLNRDIAALFKARVALYEGTWEKYHQGSIFAGDTDGRAYLQAAADAAKRVIDAGNYSILTGDPADVYHSLFIQTDYYSHPEVMFAKHYNFLEFGIGNEVWNWPGAWGVTQEMTKNYLCTDGLPIAVSPLFQGDSILALVEINRDPRLEQSIMVPGELDYVALNGDSVFFNIPFLDQCPTGYESEKFRTREIVPGLTFSGSNGRTTDVGFIFFRYAEALLIYAEAKAELGTLTQADVDLTINQLRDRVAMPPLTLGAITPDPNWPDYGSDLPDYLYEIRRERVVELHAEGYRFDDLMRWRAHSIFAGKRPTGTFYTDEFRAEFPNLFVNEAGFLDPLQQLISGPNGGYGFDPNRDYLMPIPSNELTLNPKLQQNPGW